jgi:zinc D-Ala-D-Ala carboxypeptidase
MVKSKRRGNMAYQNRKLGKYFSLDELTTTEHASLQDDNRAAITPDLELRLEALVRNILDPLREAVGVPLKINSGYRCPVLNKKVGGVPDSQHQSAQAADIVSLDKKKLTNAQLFAWILKLNLPFDQLIWEFGTLNEPSWVHVSFSPRNRRQVISIPSRNIKIPKA